MEVAADFNKRTKEGARRDMSKEAFSTWARKMLKGMIKPEFFIMVSSNFSELPNTTEMRTNFGKALDAIFDLVENAPEMTQNGKKIDEIFRKFLPSLLR